MMATKDISRLRSMGNRFSDDKKYTGKYVDKSRSRTYERGTGLGMYRSGGRVYDDGAGLGTNVNGGRMYDDGIGLGTNRSGGRVYDDGTGLGTNRSGGRVYDDGIGLDTNVNGGRMHENDFDIYRYSRSSVKRGRNISGYSANSSRRRKKTSGRSGRSGHAGHTGRTGRSVGHSGGQNGSSSMRGGKASIYSRRTSKRNGNVSGHSIAFSSEKNASGVNDVIEIKKNRRGNRRKNRKNVLLAEMAAGLAVILIIVAVTVINVITPDKEFSEKENRMLSQKPDISITSLTDGQFMSDAESYLSDQFMLRDKWISFRSTIRSLAGYTESNGIYRGSRGYLFEELKKPDEKHLKNNIDAINALASVEGYNVSMLVAPTAANVLSDYLPPLVSMEDQDAYLDKMIKSLSSDVEFIDVRDTLKEHKSEYIYYYTDHHWTTKGAYYAFCQAAEVLGISDVNEISYSRYAVCEDFAGTLASKSGFSPKRKDTIELWLSEDDVKAFENADAEENDFEPQIQYMVEYVNEGMQTFSLYNSEKLESSDKYAVFFGGNYPLIKITTVDNSKNSKSSKNTKNSDDVSNGSDGDSEGEKTSSSNSSSDKGTLMIFKDSYANCFVPFLLPYYSEIVMIDARYYYDDISQLINTEDVSDFLFLYNADTFFEDTSLADVVNTAVGK